MSITSCFPELHWVGVIWMVWLEQVNSTSSLQAMSVSRPIVACVAAAAINEKYLQRLRGGDSGDDAGTAKEGLITSTAVMRQFFSLLDSCLL